VAGTDPWGLYVTASGERNDRRVYIAQSGTVLGAMGNGTGHRGAASGSSGGTVIRPWEGSVGGEALGAGLQRAWNGFWGGSYEWLRWAACDPDADPLREMNPNVSAPVYAALIVFTPGGKGKGGTIVVRFGDDAVKYGAAAVRAVGAGDGAVKGIGNLSRASEFGIISYREMRAAKAGTGLQAHHLIESRFKDVMKVKTGDMLSIAVTPAEHQVFTNAWRKEIAYGTSASATRTRVEAAARRVYADYPDILRALGL